MDTDVVVIANLEELMQQVEANPNALFHWGLIMCSGFVVMNVPRMDEIWTLAQQSPMKNISMNNKPRPQDVNDQLIFMSVNHTYPNEVNVLSKGWDMTVSERWRNEDRPYPEKYPNVGMLHFNGGGSSKDAYFTGHDFLNPQHASWVNGTWGNAMYYVNMNWAWARYQAKSLVRPGSKGSLIQISLPVA